MYIRLTKLLSHTTGITYFMFFLKRTEHHINSNKKPTIKSGAINYVMTKTQPYHCDKDAYHANFMSTRAM